MSNENIIEKFSEKLGTEDFISPSKLVEIGIFGSTTALRSFLRKGVIPSLRISSHRVLIPRQAVLDHLRQSFTVSG